MRISAAIAAACLGLGAISTQSEAQATIKQQTNIPAQNLGAALQTLAKERNLQLIYATEEVDQLHTSGANGVLSVDQALTELLSGTGLTFGYLDDKTITVQTLRHPVRLAQASESDTTPQGHRNDASTEAPSLEEVVVAGHYEFLSVDTSGATNLPLPIEKVPQSISLVSQDFIKAADVKTLGEIAEYTPGAVNVGSQENFNTLIKIRGFAADLAIDGVNLAAGGEYSGGYEPDWAIVDRLEVVKGPSSVIYGVGSTGGLVNLVTKSATSTTPSYVSVEGGSWNSYRLEGQIAGSLTSNIRALGVAVEDIGDSFIDDIKHRTTVLYGAFNADFGPSLSAYLHGGWEYHRRTSFDGIPTEPDGSPAPVPRSFFIGSGEMSIYTSVYHGEGGLTWHATDMLDVGLKTNIQKTQSHGIAPYGDGLQPDGTLSISATKFPENDLTNYGIGGSATYHFDSLGLKNSFASAQALYQSSHFLRSYALGLFDGSSAATANLFDGADSLTEQFNAADFAPVSYRFHQAAHTLTLSGQSVVTIIDHLSALAGASYSKLTEDTITDSANDAPSNYVLTSVPINYRFPGKMSYRGGLTYEFLPETNAYVSFSQSFEPQGYIGVDNAILPPLEGEQYEAGVKYRGAGGRLLLTGAAFRTTQKNTAEYYGQVDGTTRYQAVGEVTHKGVELQALGKITSAWQANIGYAYLDPKITKDTDSANIGQTELFLPKQTANIFTEYAFDTPRLHGLSVGGGIRYVGSERTSLQGLTQDIPSYTLVDLSASYAIDQWSLRLNAHNLLNRRYFINNYQTLYYGNLIGEPANLSLTLKRTF